MTRNERGMAGAPGEGERALQARKRKVAGTVIMLMLGGAAVGFVTSIGGGTSFLTAPMAPWLAIAATVVMLVTLSWGSWRFFQVVDEVEVRDNYIASTIGLYAYFAVYFAWSLLWRGQLLPEPQHFALFCITMVLTLLAYLWMKFRP
jgi:hypothetical protein